MLKNKALYKNRFVLLVILLALLLMVVVCWVFKQRIHRIENNMESPLTVSDRKIETAQQGEKEDNECSNCKTYLITFKTYIL